MKKLNATLSLVVLVLASLTLAGTMLAQQPPDNVQGNWTIYSTSIKDGSTVTKHVQIAQYGNRITGYFEGPDQSGPIQGEVNGHFIRFSTVTRTILNFHGHVFGDNMTGDYGIHGRQAPWQAVRTTGIGAPTPTVVSYGQTMQIPPAPQPSPVAAPQVSDDSQPSNDSQQGAYSQPSNNSAPQSNTTGAPTPAPLSSEQLDGLVAPIALYPDALVAQVLAAATVPDEVTAANQWLSANSNLTGQSLEQAVDQQDWDPSIKALTLFPSVLSNLGTNLSWASSLGQAFYFQRSDVMEAVQVMRAKALAAGTIQSNSQITVTASSPGVIVIQPANPQVVYVPQYNPTIVYGEPIVVPMYTPPVVFAAPVVSFGVGVSFGGGGWGVGGGFGWGFHAWACNWGGWGGGGNTIIFDHNTYISNNTWHTANYNGYHPWGPGSNSRPYNPTTDPNGYRPGETTHYGPNGAYHPDGYYGPNGAYHHDVPGTGPANMPNGGNNGNHGLIGGNGGVEHAGLSPNGGAVGSQNHAWYGNNGTFHPAGNYKPGEDSHYGPNGGYHPNGYYGPDGGWHEDKNAGQQVPNGGNNGNHGLIGGNNGVQNPNAGMNGPGVAPPGGYHNDSRDSNLDGGNSSLQARNDNRSNLGSSRMSGDGRTNRTESNRGRSSMAGRPQRVQAMQHAHVQQHASGGGRRR